MAAADLDFGETGSEPAFPWSLPLKNTTDRTIAKMGAHVFIPSRCLSPEPES